MPTTALFAAFAAVTLAYAFLNGFNDSSSLVGTAILSRSVDLNIARVLAWVAEFCGPFLFGLAVARTMGRDLLDISHIGIHVVFAAVLAAVLWILFMTYFGMPSSSSHALVGGLVGAAVLHNGWQAVQIAGLVKILTSLFLAPILGIVAGFILLKLVLTLVQGAGPSINGVFKHLQMATIVALALSHGTNDGQKSIGLLALGLMAVGFENSFVVPLWAIAAVAFTISLGVLLGRRRTMRTVGGGIYRLQPVDSFSAQFASAVVVLGAALLGGPVSTSQVVTTSIMGVGAAERVRRVHWEASQRILWAWLATIPAVAVIAMILYRALSFWLLT